MPRTLKTLSRVGVARACQAIQSRNVYAIQGLTPERLAGALECFDLGYLRDAALLWQKIKDRCDTTRAVSEKRELEAAMLDWDILTLDGSAEAAEHKQALQEAYDELVATDALDLNKRGNVATLIKQMMHAIGHKYAVHEIVWNPTGRLSAEFRFTPLQFFENTAGRLRFLPTDRATVGEDFEEGGWMVTVGPCLMEATAIAYLLKMLPLKAWLVFCDKAGMPGLHGETDASFGSDEFRDAIASFGEDWALVTSRTAKINTINLLTGDELPHPALVDRMDRAIARIWRGADLGTMSRSGGVGANPQKSETDILSAADPLLISETLQNYFDRWVIRYRFGCEPKAYFSLKVVTKIDYAQELKTDDFLIRAGVPRGKSELLRRYGRPVPALGAELVGQPGKPAPTATGKATSPSISLTL